MVQKVIYSDIESNRTQGEGGALLINDLKRAVNEMIDGGAGGGGAIPEPTIIETNGTDIFSLTLGDYSVNRTSVWNSLINKPPVDNIKAIIHVRHTTVDENTYEVFRVIKDVTNNDMWVQSRGEDPAIDSGWVKLVRGDDTRLSDSREWIADIVPQPEAEGGTSTTPRKWTAQRVFQAITAWVSNNLKGAAFRDIATTAQAQSGTGTQVPDVSGVLALLNTAGIKNTAQNLVANTTDIRTLPSGMYGLNADHPNNPFTDGATLIVGMRQTGSSTFIIQRGSDNQIAIATKYSNPIGNPIAWKELTALATTEIAGIVEKATPTEAEGGAANKYPDAAGVLASINQFGVGINVPTSIISDLNSVSGGRGFRQRSVTSVTLNTPAGLGNGTVLEMSFNNVSTSRILFSDYQLRAWLQQYSYGVAVGSAELWHRVNTTVDSNGFIKQASPVVKLFSDRIEVNDSLEVADAEFERISTGHYVLRNVPLLSRNGWYIETPKDRNNNIYFTIDYDESVEGELTIRTYEPDYSTGRATNGDPVDILEGRYVSLRFKELPELYPIPDIQESDDIVDIEE